MIEVRVLGTIDARIDGRPVVLGGYQQQAVLAMLVAARGRVVPVDRIIDQLWEDAAPERPQASLQVYISRLRRLLEPDRPPRTPPTVLVSEASGYALRLPDDAVDSWAFEQDLRRVQEMRPLGLSPASAEKALTLLRGAMDRWHGRPYEQFADEPWAQASITRLAEAYRVAQERILVCHMVLGRHGEAVLVAQALTEAEPFRGQAWRLLAIALWANHRSAEALDALRRHRRYLADELGLEPEPALAELERGILEQRGEVLEEALTFGLERKPAPAAATGEFPVRPAQLPRSPGTFSARETALAELTRHTGDPEGAPLVVVSGVGGVGKTTLAVRWAHQAADRFPDGQLYAELRGYGPEDAPAAPGDVLHGFLTALGVPDHRVPTGDAERTALFRSALAGRRMLLVLDNARDAEQVRPLLPGAAGCAVVVTSRGRLSGLEVSDGARTVHLDGFDAEEARAYLRARLGPAMTDGSPASRDAIVARCGGLPLALAVVCARVVSSGFPLSTVAAELTGEEGLDAFGPDLRAVFSWSYRRLPTAAARLFRHLALHPGPDIGLAAAVNVAGGDRAVTRVLLRTLCDAHLLQERRPGRFGYHDLVRSYAAELAMSRDEPMAREEVLRRLIEYHLHSAIAATDAYLSYPRPYRGGSVSAGVVPEGFASAEAALAWMDAEYENCMALAELCRTPLRERYLGPFAWTLVPYQQDVRFYLEDSFALIGWALAAAERGGDWWWIGFLNYVSGRGHLWLDQGAAARPYLERAIEVGRVTADPLRLAHGLQGLAVAITGLYRIPTPEEAAAAYPHSREALENYRRVSPDTAQPDEANTLHSIAWYHFHQPGGREKAREMLEEALAINLRWSNTIGAANSTMHLGRFHFANGDVPAAVAAFEQALDMHEAGRPSQRIEPLIGLYTVHLAMGDHAAAERARGEAIGLLKGARYPDLRRIEKSLGITAG
ncbi:BTAD domain-containing putative transcriptional regulator [Actinoplanes sp. NPDC051851]|uniref:BTAD domain-containing putative transcriptional regulator n=1 Tax=Actinoplanes sp. NPDC051851 TaxID=3154753 RepID=UPI0034365251